MSEVELEIAVARAGVQEMAHCLSIRHAVFVVEQSVPLALEQDGRDVEAMHFLACRGGEPVGTARVINVDERTARIGRVAVLKNARGQGIGEALLRAVLDEPALASVTRFELHAQVDATAFYQRLGFQVYGAPFIEASMPHAAMCFERRPG